LFALSWVVMRAPVVIKGVKYGYLPFHA
jgi:hypothetical protein